MEFLSLLETECSRELLNNYNLVNELRKAILYGFLQKIISTYRTLSIEYLSTELRVPKAAIVQILVEMIMDNKINGLIDETKGVFLNVDCSEQALNRKKGTDLLNIMAKTIEKTLNRGSRGSVTSFVSF